MLFLLLSLTSFAAPPDDIPWSISAGSRLVEQFGVSDDRQWVSAISNDAVFLDVGAWTVHHPGCGATAAAVSNDNLWAACSGVVQQYQMRSGVLTEDADQTWTPGGYVLGLWHYDGALYAMVEVDGATDELHRSVDGVLNGGSFPIAVRDGLYEGRVKDGQLLLWHGADDITTVVLGSGTAVSSTAIQVGTFRDLAVSYQLKPYLVVEDLGSIYELTAPSNYTVALSGLSTPTALALSDDLTDPWAVLSTSAGLEVRDASAGLGPLIETLSSTAIGDAIVVDGYALLGQSNGSLSAATAAPWVDASVVPTSASEGDDVLVSFSSDTAASWKVVLDGQTLDSGDTTAGATVTTTVTVDGQFAEGATGLWVLATDAAGNIGHDRVDVIVDSPPPAPTVAVGFSDSALSVTISGVDDADLDHYIVYVSDGAFAASDFATGGPGDFDGADELELPVTVDAEPGEDVVLRLAPLTNGVSYTIGARAVDAGGLEGPMSETVSGTPQETFSAAELAGETGGVSCSSTQGPGWLFLGGLLGLLGRRRSVLAAGLLTSTVASAENPLCAGGGEKSKDMTPTCADFELRYGSRSIDDPSIQSVYGSKSHGILMIEAGPQFFRVLEVDLGFGLYRKFDRANSVDGELSDVVTMLSLWPLSLGATARLQIFDEQLVVPFVRGGFDYIMFGERWDDGAGGKASVRGAKFGNHWGIGANILLDPFAPGRASLLEAQTGINDTFITIEYRKINARQGEGFDLSGSNVSVGIKLDY